MKIKKQFILAALLMLIFISACGRNNILEDETNNEINEENPFENIEDMTDNGWQIDYSYGWGITNYDPEECKKIARQSFPEFDPDIWEKTCKTIAKRV